MNTYRSQAVYESVRGLRAFNMPSDARKTGANQYGKRYAFPDGSTLRIDSRGNTIECRMRPHGPGSSRVLWSTASEQGKVQA